MAQKLHLFKGEGRFGILQVLRKAKLSEVYLDMVDIQKNSILVYIHSESAKEILYSLLTNPKFQIEVAETSGECLKKIHSNKFDALVIDACFLKTRDEVNIPLLDELTVSLPVIVTAGKESLKIENKIREGKIFYYLVKPVSQSELVQVLEEAVKWYERFL